VAGFHIGAVVLYAAMMNGWDKGPVWSRRQPGINALDASSGAAAALDNG